VSDCSEVPRLFSATPGRGQASSQLFEAILLLKVNSFLWNAFSVGQAMGMTANSNSDCEEIVIERVF
jgi:hypothetical protein